MDERELLADIDRIMQLRGQGLTTAEIGARLFMCPASVRRRVNIAGLKEQYYCCSRKYIFQKNRDAIREMLESGARIGEICERFGVSKNTVQRWRRALKIPPGNHGGWNSLHLDPDELEKLWNEGKNFTEIGRIVGATGSTVRLNMVRAGIVGAVGNIRIRKFPADPEELKKLRELLSGGFKNSELAEMLGIASSTVSGWRRKLGINDIGHGRRRRW